MENKTTISQLNTDQLIIIAEFFADWLVDYRPCFLAVNFPAWIERNRPNWLNAKTFDYSNDIEVPANIMNLLKHTTLV